MDIALITRIDNEILKVKDSADSVYKGILDTAYHTCNCLVWLKRALEYEYIDETEYGSYLDEIRNQVYPYLETIYYLKQGGSELGSISNALVEFAKGVITAEDAIDELR